MLTIQMDGLTEEIKEAIINELRTQCSEIGFSQAYYTWADLEQITNMTRNHIKDQFYYDPRFKKFKSGSKTLFPVKETNQFLKEWWKEQEEAS